MYITGFVTWNYAGAEADTDVFYKSNCAFWQIIFLYIATLWLTSTHTHRHTYTRWKLPYESRKCISCFPSEHLGVFTAAFDCSLTKICHVFVHAYVLKSLHGMRFVTKVRENHKVEESAGSTDEMAELWGEKPDDRSHWVLTSCIGKWVQRRFFLTLKVVHKYSPTMCIHTHTTVCTHTRLLNTPD